MKAIYVNFVRNRNPLALGLFAVWSVLNVALNFWDAPWKGIASALSALGWYVFALSVIFLIDERRKRL